MKVINLGGKGSLLDQFLSEVRDVQIQQERLRFRNNLTRIGEVMAYEISKKLPFADEDVITPLGIATVPTIKEQPMKARIKIPKQTYVISVSLMKVCCRHIQTA